MQRRVEVVVRVRPIHHHQQHHYHHHQHHDDDEAEVCVDLHKDGHTVSVFDPALPSLVDHRRDYRGDTIYGPHVSNQEIFECVVRPKLSLATPATPDTLCFLAYGHTNSGKTHTVTGHDDEPGVLSLCVQELLEREEVVEVAMLEVYMNQVYDLLAQSAPRRVRRCPAPARLGSEHAASRVWCGDRGGGPARPHRTSVVVVEDLTTCALTSMEEWHVVTRYGLQSRRTAPTERNARSSRSHAIFTVKSRGVRLCFVDLAGSERQTVYSPRLNQESIDINKSLSRLSTVLEALSSRRTCETRTSSSYVNFRDTTLTVLLERYLSGASRTTFLACIHPAAFFYAETLSTLRYTERLRRIKTRTTTHVDVMKEEERMAQATRCLRASRHGMTTVPAPLCSSASLLQELVEMQRQVRESRETCARLTQSHQRRIVELEHMLLESQRRASSTAVSQLPIDEAQTDEVMSERHRHRSAGLDGAKAHLEACPIAATTTSAPTANVLRETKRSATRCKSAPPWRVCLDEYFDFLWSGTELQVVGYVTTMACLPPRRTYAVDDTSLVFLDVDDLESGLNMLDAGVPPRVRLHDAHCAHHQSWQAVSVTDANGLVGAGQHGAERGCCYVLVFCERRRRRSRCAEANAATRPTLHVGREAEMVGGDGGGSSCEVYGDAALSAYTHISCGPHGKGNTTSCGCKGYCATESLLPMAVVIGTPACTPAPVKECLLERLMALHTAPPWWSRAESESEDSEMWWGSEEEAGEAVCSSLPLRTDEMTPPPRTRLDSARGPFSTTGTCGRSGSSRGAGDGKCRVWSMSRSASMGCSASRQTSAATACSDDPPHTPSPSANSATPRQRLLPSSRHKSRAVHFTSCKESGCVPS